MTGRTLGSISIGPKHPRRPEPSFIEIALMPSDRKRDRMDIYTLTREQALELAEQALASVRIIRSLAPKATPDD